MTGGFYERREFTFGTARLGLETACIAPETVTGSTCDHDKRHTIKTETGYFFAARCAT